MKPTTPPIWILIDGQNTVHRDAYGVGVTKAAETLGRRIDLMVERWKPAAIVTAWDTDTPTFRHKLFPGYKGERKRLDGIGDALAAAKDECLRRGVAALDAPGFEADDLLATLAGEARANGYRIVVYSGDKDLHQLIRAGEVTQLTAVRREFGKLRCHWVTEEDLLDKYGVLPSQWVDFKCLTGDPSDKIEGVHNIGPQIARQVLNDCGSIEGFYRNPYAAAISSAKSAAIINAKPRMALLRQLCTLRTDVPLPELWREGV